MTTYFNTSTATEGSLPASGQRLDTGQWVMGLPQADDATRQACGFVVVTNTARPADTPTVTYVSGVSCVGDVVTRTWTARPWTIDELAGKTTDTNRTNIETYLSDAKAALDAIIATNALAFTQADLRVLQQQVKDVARINKRLVRLALRQLDSTA